MTKIAYIRATNRQQQQPVACNTLQQVKTITLQPPIPTMASRLSFNAPGIQRPSHPPIPKPMMMTPTTRFNTNPNVLIFEQQNGGRISKPLMEKRRRARINQCLSQLKTIVVDSAGQLTQNNKCKLEKADILELTVNYVKQLHQEHEQKQGQDDQYIAGYSECVKQISEFIAQYQDFPEEHSQSLTKYLQQNLTCMQQSNQQQQHRMLTEFPPSPAPSSESFSSSNSNGTMSNCSPTATTDSTIVTSSKRSYEEMAMSDGDDEYYYEDNDSNPLDQNFEYDHPLNLKVKVGYTDEDDVWRPW